MCVFRGNVVHSGGGKQGLRIHCYMFGKGYPFWPYVNRGGEGRVFTNKEAVKKLLAHTEATIARSGKEMGPIRVPPDPVLHARGKLTSRSFSYPYKGLDTAALEGEEEEEDSSAAAAASFVSSTTRAQAAKRKRADEDGTDAAKAAKYF